jgi:Domain of unknown function (DUF4386)
MPTILTTAPASRIVTERYVPIDLARSAWLAVIATSVLRRYDPMRDQSVLRLGWVAAVLLGLAKLLSGAAYLIMPAEQRAEVAGALLLPSVANGAPVLFALFWLEAVVGIFGFAVVPALSSLVREKGEGWMHWANTLAIVGYAVTAVGYLQTIARLPGIATAYVAGDASTKAALLAVWKSSPDLFGFWGYGAIGIWVLVLTILAWRGRVFPRTFNYLGLALAVLYLLVLPAAGLKIQPLLIAIAALGGLVAPIWYVWSGLILRRKLEV